MLEKLAYPPSKTFPRLLVAGLWILYLLAFWLFHGRVGPDLIALAVFPIFAAGWYFGPRFGVLLAALSVSANFLFLFFQDHYPVSIVLDLGTWIASLALIFTGGMVGSLSALVRRHRATLVQLQGLENDRESHTRFLSLLNDITLTALQTDDLASLIEVLVKRTGELFNADTCTFNMWDETLQAPIPKAAYGYASEIFPTIRFKPGEPQLASFVLSSSQIIVIDDLANSPHRDKINPRIAALVGTQSLIGLPLIAHDRKLGSIVLSYRQPHQFSQPEIERAELASRQIALALARIQSFEDSERRVKELAVLHEIAMAPTQVEGVDQLLDLATEIIGRNLFPDNFGILLLDEANHVLVPHRSYRVYTTENYDPHTVTVPLGQGVIGQVAEDGKTRRIGDVRQIEKYLNVDSRTRSELCVPLKAKERILGVINAENREVNAFSPNDEDLMDILAGQLATALEYLRSREAERHWMGTLAHSNELISALSHVTTQIERAFSPSDVIRIVEEEFQKMGLISLLSLYQAETGEMVIQFGPLFPDRKSKAESGVFDYRVQAEKLETLFGIENILAPMVLPAPLKTMETVLQRFPPDVVAEILCARGVTGDTEIIHLPLLFENRLLGALWLWGKDLTRADLPVMFIFARQMAVTLENARLFEEVQNLAITDPLTGFYNRRGLFEIGRIEFARSRRANREFSAVMVDIDHFKQINDTHGHFAGDRVLQNFACLCKDSIREVDLIGRYGGEEIVILLPETGLKAGVEVAERLRHIIAETPIQITDDLALHLTASLGVAVQDGNTPNLETLIARADQAMYVAKHKGRDRVASSG